MRPASERPKRRHARPHVLDSDDDDNEEKESENQIQDEETIPDKAEDIVPDDNAPHKMVNRIFFTMILKCSTYNLPPALNKNLYVVSQRSL